MFLVIIVLSQFFVYGLAERYPIIPKPVNLIPAEGEFIVNSTTRITVNSYSSDAKQLGYFISDFISESLNTKIKIDEDCFMPENGAINIIIDDLSGIENEGYNLSVTPDAVTIKASKAIGAFWGFQTLRQLMPPDIESRTKIANCMVAIPCLTVEDFPRFSYRGLHLDVSRHMFSTEFIKKYIDLLALYKLNTFHWHLTDDQGWRIEIKKYPKLQEISAYRDETLIGHKKRLWRKFDKKRYGGYYTQQEIKEIVEYAKLRHITIIPEIELPGHSLAVLTAYPDLGCTGGPYKTATTWGIFDDIYCAGNEKTFEFLKDVLSEVLDMFPGNYIHIGGDEVIKTCWKNCPKCQARIKTENLKNESELQSYFIRRIEHFVNQMGRKIIGWDEILEGGLADNATVMSWRGIEGGIKAAKLNHNVIMSPYSNLYFDYYQSISPSEPLAIGGYTTLKDVYDYEPIPCELTEKEAKYILGAQANVWTEYMPSSKQVEYMAYPRVIALAEISWTPVIEKNYEDFISRLRFNILRLKEMQVNYSKHGLDGAGRTKQTFFKNMRCLLKKYL